MHSAPLRLFNPSAPGDVPFLARFLTLALLVGGAFGALTSFALARGFWVWHMPDLAYRFLAGAAAAYAVGGLLTLRSQRWAATELLLATVVIYGVPLGAAMALDHSAIDWSKPIAWGFLAVVTPALVIACGALCEPARAGRRVRRPAGAGAARLPVRAGRGDACAGRARFRRAAACWLHLALGERRSLDAARQPPDRLDAADDWRRRAARCLARRPRRGGRVPADAVGLLPDGGARPRHPRQRTPAFVTEDVVYSVVFAIVAVDSVVLWLQGAMATRRLAPG